MAPVSMSAGTFLAGRYRLGEPLGAGQLSSVYAADDTHGGARVALKLFSPSLRARASAMSDFQTQARAASGLGVEGIARAYDFGIDANTGLYFATSEKISWLCVDRRLAAEGRTLSVRELSRALAVLARALDAAHGAHLVHRALTPRNLFISPDNPEWARITDFGVSTLHRGSAEAMGFGGPHGYSAPEAVDAGVLGAPAMDLFSLGLVVFFALTRGSPFRSLRGPVFDTQAHWSELNQSLSPLSERAKELGCPLDRRFDAWFDCALAPRARERFTSASQMAQEFAAVVAVAAPRTAREAHTASLVAAVARPSLFQAETGSFGVESGALRITTADAFATTARASAPESARAASSRPGNHEFSRANENSGRKRPILLAWLGILAAAATVLLALSWVQDRSTRANARAAGTDRPREPTTAPAASASSKSASLGPVPSAAPQISPAESGSAASMPPAPPSLAVNTAAAVPKEQGPRPMPKVKVATALAPVPQGANSSAGAARKALRPLPNAALASSKPGAKVPASSASSAGKKKKCGPFLACK